MERHLHIISFDVPFPADYGGVIDIFYMIKTLHQQGIQLHLHCYEYGRGVQPELEKYCITVKYYHRREGHKGFSHQLPYIVCSRYNKLMLDDLLNDNYPILAEGIHCTYLLNDDRFKDRKILVRLHNVEHAYYRQLCRSEKSLFKKIYYWNESRLLKKYENKIAARAPLIAMSEGDVITYRKEFQNCSVRFLPVFVPSGEVVTDSEKGCYCLYHGNLSVAENEQAVALLLEYVFDELPYPFLIAGKNPTNRLKKLVDQYPRACLVANPSEEEMLDLVKKAQINIIPSLNCTGIKFKLLNALFNGKHCIVNEATIKHTGLETICHECNDFDSLKNKIEYLFEKPIGIEEINSRKEVMSEYFDNEKNGKQLIAWIW